MLHAQRGSISVKKYFHYRFRPQTIGRSDAAREMARIFKQSFERRVRVGDTPGLLLSGGLDSRMVLACSDQQVDCFHFNDEPNLEYRAARSLAAAHGSPFQYFPMVTTGAGVSGE